MNPFLQHIIECLKINRRSLIEGNDNDRVIGISAIQAAIGLYELLDFLVNSNHINICQNAAQCRPLRYANTSLIHSKRITATLTKLPVILDALEIAFTALIIERCYNLTVNARVAHHRMKDFIPILRQ